MARTSKTSPFGPKRHPEESRTNTEGEKKDDKEEESSSSSSDSEENTQDKEQEKAMGKRPMQAKTRKRKTTVYEMISGPERAKRTVTKRGRGKSMAYTARLWSKHHPWIDVPKKADSKPKSTQDKKQGKRPMQARNGNQKTTLAKGNVTKRGRGQSTANTKRSPRKRADPKLKEEDDVFPSSETDSEEVCKRIKIESHDHDDDDTDNDGGGAGTHGNLTSLGIEVVTK
ncbi:transcriptional regulator ATRX homolog [Helianthus annuus]|uniref:transcriptional regulator ATRX homolog n=1 Tax=Helianthus annuus TaxID=4232 RepID=UPI000B8FA425|nr:transcriptional regulator ATRX homolog [Helianthus annuus]